MSTPASPRSLLVWHVHGSWMESLVAGQHRYVIPVNPAKDADGRGLMGRNWPRAQEIWVDELSNEDIDLVILQRPEEFDLVDRWLGRRPGVDIPTVYVEHNTPRPYAVDSVDPLAGRRDITLIHVTDFNRLMWDNGLAPTRVITHGVADPGPLYTGDIAAAATMINEPLRRWRTVGSRSARRTGRAHPDRRLGHPHCRTQQRRARSGQGQGRCAGAAADAAVSPPPGLSAHRPVDVPGYVAD
jgi:hypothetical protein